MLLVTAIFGVTTLAIVLAAQVGFARLPFDPLERYSHTIASATLPLCGLAIRFLAL